MSKSKENFEFIAFAAAPRTATANSGDLENRTARGVRLWLNITAVSGTTPTLDIKLQWKDPVSGLYFDIPGANFPQKTATGTDDLTVYPGIAETATEAISDAIPRNWRALATIGGTAPSFNFSLGGSYLI